MERITDTRSKGINRNALRTWALMLAVAGMAGRGLIQTHILAVGSVTTEQLLEMMNASSQTMILATVSLALQLVETMAVPLFALLLAEGVTHTSDLKQYALRVNGCALASEIPYDLLVHGKAFAMTAQNPVFGMVLGLVVLTFFRMYEEKGLKNFFVKLLVVAMGILWAKMLRIDMGACMVLMVWPMFALRHKTMYRNLMAACMAMICCMFSLFFVVAPFGCLLLHFYNGEKGEEEPSRVVTYLAYPVVTALLAAAGIFLL